MTDTERLEKLETARNLIREVEFSYGSNSTVRHAIFQAVVRVFGPHGGLSEVIQQLKKTVRG